MTLTGFSVTVVARRYPVGTSDAGNMTSAVIGEIQMALRIGLQNQLGNKKDARKWT